MAADLIKALEYIHPSDCDYQTWINVGMALKEEGYSIEDWEEWSRRDMARYHVGECRRKWTSFRGASSPVTAGTIVKMAKENGYMPCGTELEWDSVIGLRVEDEIINTNWVEGREIEGPTDWNPVKELITYLETLFDVEENVGYVTESYKNEDGKYVPKKGSYDRTAGELIAELNKCKGDICNVIGDYHEEAGAWIRFNPLDGKGVKNENVSAFKYALVESDNMELDRQNALLRELELPIAVLVYSGGKSLHAIVRIDALNYADYRKRVDFLYNVCSKNGLVIDTQNRNPSRLSRMPGVIRNGKKQYIVDINIGKKSYDEWLEWISDINDNMPGVENLFDVWGDLPNLAPPLIDGVLRQGHKMLVAGPSKAGKSYALIELCAAIAEGRKWMGFDCTKGKIMYVNLELDRASCLHRFKDVYEALGWEPRNIANIDIWNLRGKSVPMDKLAPKLIRRAANKGFIAIVIDPIYKVITGDENSADQMANFCNQFDKVCTELGCAVIYCHHHSKGLQGGKRSMDRASGSGVFARDPDALLDIIELELTDALIKQEVNKAVCDVCARYLDEDNYGIDDAFSKSKMLEISRKRLSSVQMKELELDIAKAEKAVKARSAWRIEGTLREFPKFAPMNVWFDYPVHRADDTGSLSDLDAGAAAPGWQKAMGARKSKEEKAEDRKTKLETAYNALSMNGKVTVGDLAEYLDLSEKTARRYIKENDNYIVADGEVFRVEQKK